MCEALWVLTAHRTSLHLQVQLPQSKHPAASLSLPAPHKYGWSCYYTSSSCFHVLPAQPEDPVSSHRREIWYWSNLIDRKGGFPALSTGEWSFYIMLVPWGPPKKPLWKQMGHSRGISSSWDHSFIPTEIFIETPTFTSSFVTGLQLWAKQTQTLCSWSLQPVENDYEIVKYIIKKLWKISWRERTVPMKNYSEVTDLLGNVGVWRSGKIFPRK